MGFRGEKEDVGEGEGEEKDKAEIGSGEDHKLSESTHDGPLPPVRLSFLLKGLKPFQCSNR